MKQYPATPGLGDAPAGFFEEGHLWIQELIAGELLRFQVAESGAIRAGSRRRTFDPGDSPLRFRHAVQALETSLDVRALRSAVSAMDEVVFFGIATQYAGVQYDWGRLPSVLGIDVWDGAAGEFLAVDAVERVFEHIGLEPVTVHRKEVHVRDYDPEAAVFPESAWRDGPAAGVVLRKKTGERVAVPNPDVAAEAGAGAGAGGVAGTGTGAGTGGGDWSRREPLADSATEAAAATATRERFDRVADAAVERGMPVTFDTTYDRLLASIYREHHDWLVDGGGEGSGDGAAFDLGPFRDAVAARLSEFLEE